MLNVINKNKSKKKKNKANISNNKKGNKQSQKVKKFIAQQAALLTKGGGRKAEFSSQKSLEQEAQVKRMLEQKAARHAEHMRNRQRNLERRRIAQAQKNFAGGTPEWQAMHDVRETLLSRDYRVEHNGGGSDLTSSARLKLLRERQASYVAAKLPSTAKICKVKVGVWPPEKRYNRDKDPGRNCDMCRKFKWVVGDYYTYERHNGIHTKYCLDCALQAYPTKDIFDMYRSIPFNRSGRFSDDYDSDDQWSSRLKCDPPKIYPDEDKEDGEVEKKDDGLGGPDQGEAAPVQDDDDVSDCGSTGTHGSGAEVFHRERIDSVYPHLPSTAKLCRVEVERRYRKPCSVCMGRPWTGNGPYDMDAECHYVVDRPDEGGARVKYCMKCAVIKWAPHELSAWGTCSNTMCERANLQDCPVALYGGRSEDGDSQLSVERSWDEDEDEEDEEDEEERESMESMEEEEDEEASALPPGSLSP